MENLIGQTNAGGSNSLQRHNFEKYKNEIQKFSKEVPQMVDLGSFRTRSMAIFSHKITGDEMNNFVNKLQTKLMDTNKKIREIISEFAVIYNAFDTLDKDYIEGIIIAVKAAEESSKQALKAQDDITKTIKALKLTVEKLEEFKNDIDKYTNINDIKHFDEHLQEYRHRVELLYNDQNNILKSLHIEAGKTADLQYKCEHLETVARQTADDIVSLQQYRKVLEGYVHLSDIDNVWNNTQQLQLELKEQSENLTALSQHVSTFRQQATEDIISLQQYRRILESYAHLSDIDNVWEDTQKHTTELTMHMKNFSALAQQVSEFSKQASEDIAALQHYRSILETYVHLPDIDRIWADTQIHATNIQTLTNNIEALSGELATTKESLSKRIRIAYWVAGIIFTFSITHLLLNIFHII